MNLLGRKKRALNFLSALGQVDLADFGLPVATGGAKDRLPPLDVLDEQDYHVLGN